MSLYRVIFAPPGGLTSPRTVHHGFCLAGKSRCRCPQVRGYIHEVWIEASRPGEAAILAAEKYPNAHVVEIHRGLSQKQYAAFIQHLTGYTPRSSIHAMLCREAGVTLQVHADETQIAASAEAEP